MDTARAAEAKTEEAKEQLSQQKWEDLRIRLVWLAI